MLKKRFWEIDFARGAAVAAMLVFNWQYALNFFGLLPEFDYSSLFWSSFAKAVVFSFVFIAGVSLYLSYEKNQKQSEFKKKFFLRGAKLLGLGMLATLATFLFVPKSFIAFGVLPLIGFSVIAGVAFLKLNAKKIFAAGAPVIASGIFLSSQSFGFPWLFWLGFAPEGFSSIDYEPVLPWFGVFLLGTAFGKKFYYKAERRFGFAAPTFGKNLLAKSLCFLGRHSLAIYVFHQPFLVALLLLLGAVTLPF